MKRNDTPWVFFFVTLITFLASTSQAQQSGPGPGITEVPSLQAVSSRVLSFSDTVAGQPDGALTVTFAIYPDQQSTTAAWTETQVVQVTQNKYSALLGSTTPDGIPPDAFAADHARWLGVQINGTEKRYLLVSVPYAMKAVEAERLGGLLPSQFVTVSQLQAALSNAATISSSSSGSKAATGVAAQASSNPPQPATDFTDNNASEVLLVTQQGTGFAIHAISAGDAALFAENSTATGTALRALASSTTGTTTGILGQSASPNGVAGVFDNTGGGQILSLRSSGNEVVSVDNFGNFRASQIQAFNFVGGGFGLTNIPNSATTATPANSNNTIVARDQFGGFSASQIQAFNFVGGGFGLTNIPNTATTATSANSNDTIVARDQFGGFSASQIQAFNFVGGGFGLTNIPNSATTATPANSNNTIVARDQFGSFSASQIQAFNFVGGGFGLTNIPNSATTATSANTPNTIVARDQSGNSYIGNLQADILSINQFIFSKGGADFSNANFTAPVKVTTSANAPQACGANSSLLIKSDAPAGQQLFICNAAGNGWVLLGDGAAGGVSSVGAADSSIAIGGTTSAPTIEVANGGITSAKLAPNAVTAVNIADGSLSATKIAGTAATLSGNNLFSGSQTIQQGLSVGGALSAATASINGALSAGTASISGPLSSGPLTASNPTISPGATGIHGDGIVGVDASTTFGVGLQARTTGPSQGGIAATFTNAQPGVLISGRLASPAPSGYDEIFKVDTFGAMVANSVSAQFGNGGGVQAGMLVKLKPNSTQVVPVAVTDRNGALGIVTEVNGSVVRVAYGGLASCRFDSGPLTIGDYVGISPGGAGNCVSFGSTIPTQANFQIIGRIVNSSFNFGTILVFGPERYSAGSVSSITTGPGLTGGPITSSGMISIPVAGVSNIMLQNSSVTVNAGVGLIGGGTVPLGGSLTLGNTGVLLFNNRSGAVLPAAGDYSFSMLRGTASSTQLPATVVYNNQSNTFSADQTIGGALTTNSLATNAISGTSASITGSSNGTTSVVTVADNSAANNAAALSVTSQNNLAANFFSVGPNILAAGTATHNVLGVTSSGMNVVGNVSATTFSGDGSALTNVNASSVGGVTTANLATTSALNAEITARQSADAALATSISAETAARQNDVSNLQTGINNVSAADAKLAASNTFTAGTQDFSGAGATLPVRSLLSTQTPANCVAGKELLIKTDAPAGQQLFICDASGTTWNLVGDGASGGVTSFNGRNGSVSSSSNDYSFAQISGSVGPGQMPALSGDVSSAAGSTITALAPSGISAGTYTKLTIDAKGRATGGSQASFSDLTGSLSTSQLPALSGDVSSTAGSAVTTLAPSGVAPGTYTKLTVDGKGRATTGSQAAFADLVGNVAQNQLPSNVVYNNQANTFTADQTVNGTVKATAFSGSGAFLTFVNATMFNGLGIDNFAQMNTANSFSKKQTMVGASSGTAALNIVPGATPASPVIGDVWNTGTTIQYVDTSSNTLALVTTPQSGGMQMVKLTASITPTSVGSQSCTEQSFSVSGVNAADLLLSTQSSTRSPGNNIAIGGWRVPAANTVAIQFCNVSRNSSTPAAGTYTFALMR